MVMQYRTSAKTENYLVSNFGENMEKNVRQKVRKLGILGKLTSHTKRAKKKPVNRTISNGSGSLLLGNKSISMYSTVRNMKDFGCSVGHKICGM